MSLMCDNKVEHVFIRTALAFSQKNRKHLNHER